MRRPAPILTDTVDGEAPTSAARASERVARDAAAQDAAAQEAAARAADEEMVARVRPTAAGRPAPIAPLPVARIDSDTRAASLDAGTLAPGAPGEVDAPNDPVEGEGIAPEIGPRQVWAAARARRKALRAEVRRFTVRQRRSRMLWIGVAGSLVLLVLGSLGAAYSPLFAVQQISVVGTSSLDATAVEAALGDQLGTPLPRVDSSAIKAALVQFPLVESYTLEARPPHELVVRIVERTPIGSIESAAGYTLVDAAGVALSTTPEAPAGHPVITATGGVGSPAFDAIGTVFRSLPVDIREQVTAMAATTANDVTLTLGGTGTDVVWGNADDSAHKAVVLASAMAAKPPADVYSYDVSSPGAVVVR